jgi:signal transduction histidine kinase
MAPSSSAPSAPAGPVPAKAAAVRGPSLRMRLTLWAIAISSIITGVLALVIVLYQRDSLERFFSARVETRSFQAVQSVMKLGPLLSDATLQDALTKDPSQHWLAEDQILVVYQPGGAVVASSVQPAPPLAALTNGAQGSRGPPAVYKPDLGFLGGGFAESEGRTLIWRITDRDGRPLVVAYGVSESFFQEQITLVQKVLLLILPIGVASTGLATWLVTGLAMAPLRRLSGLAEAFAPERLQRPVQLDIPSVEFAQFRRELESVRERLRSALLAQERFIANVSHELKTPIATILTEAQTMDVKHHTADDRRFVASVIDEMRRLGKTVESFLTLTKIRGGKGLANPAPCNLNDIAMEAVDASNAFAREHEVSIAPTLADGDEPPVVEGDADLLRVLVDNLIRNAIKFSSAGQRVMLTVKADDRQGVVEVRDFGPGVPAEYMDKIFDRFVQAPAEAPRGRGHGLGLSIAQGIAEIHGGTITVENCDGGGARFSLRVPLGDHPWLPHE